MMIDLHAEPILCSDFVRSKMTGEERRMQKFPVLDIITGMATLVGGGMILIYDQAELAEWGAPGIVVFVCFLTVAARLGWGWIGPKLAGRKEKGREEVGGE